MTFDYPGRVKRLQDRMRASGTDVVLLSVGADLPYFTGYEAMASERMTVLVVNRQDVPILLIPELEAPRVLPGEFEVRPWAETDDPIGIATSVVDLPGKVAVGDHMWSAFLIGFQKNWTHAEWVQASVLTRNLRVRKDPEEVEMLRVAAHGVDRVMARIPGEVLFEGHSEREVARQLQEMTVEEGHDVAEFTIVGSGLNAASPHHQPGERIIQRGDLVVCDFGGRLNGYYSDSTRTFVVGEPSDEQGDIHSVVLRANEAGRAAVAPGVPCERIDRAARTVIEEAGFGEHFIHRTGHGIGLEVHEHPYIVEGNRMTLEPGMAFSIEPGIYLEGHFGARIEDIVVCEPEGADSLNEADRRLVSVF